MYAIERNAQVLACAKHNAEVYGAANKIAWYEGDCFKIIEKELADMGEYSVVFASPPWGGICTHPILPALSKVLMSVRRSWLQIRLSIQPV